MQQADVLEWLQARTGLVPACALRDDDGIRAGCDMAGDLDRVQVVTINETRIPATPGSQLIKKCREPLRTSRLLCMEAYPRPWREYDPSDLLSSRTGQRFREL